MFFLGMYLGIQVKDCLAPIKVLNSKAVQTYQYSGTSVVDHNSFEFVGQKLIYLGA